MLCAVLLVGCSTVQTEQSSSVLDLLDLRGYPDNVYIGISGPYATKARMTEQAILSAAKSILLKQALALDTRLVLSEDSQAGLTAFAADEKALYDDTQLAETIRRLEVLSVVFNDEAGAVVLVADPLQAPTDRPYQGVTDETGRPVWLSHVPKVDGYRFGIGSSKPYYYLHDSLEASDFAAAQNLLDLGTEHAYSVESVKTDKEQMQRVLYQAQRGLLRGFSIVARYYDERNRTYWSLAVCED